MAIQKLNHVAVAVKSLDEAIPLFRDVLGLPVSEPEVVEAQKVRLVMVPVGDTRIELLEPLDDESPIARHLEKKGPGLHHLCYQVDDVAATIESMLGAGLKMIDPQPRGGAHGTRIAFAHPKATGGVLTEFAEVTGEH